MNKIKDILNRTIKQFDIILIRRGKYHNFFIGIYKGKSCFYLDGNFITHSCPEQCYIVENPNEKELQIRDNIMKELGLILKERKEG